MPPHTSKPLLALALALSALVGCSNTPTTSGGIDSKKPTASGLKNFRLYNPFSVTSKFQNLVQSGQLNEAEKFYADNRNELYLSSEVETSRKHLVQQLTAGESTKYPTLIEKLDKPMNLADWPQMKRDLQLAATYLQHINTRPILQDSRSYIQHYEALEQITNKQTNSLKENAGSNLITFTSTGSGYFPTEYPITLAQQQLHQISAQAAPQLIETINKLPIDKAQSFIRQNHNWMEKSSLQKITDTYLDIHAKNNSIKQPMPLTSRMNALKQIGLDNQLKLAIITTTGSPPHLTALSQKLGGTLVAPDENPLASNRTLKGAGYDLAIYIKLGKPSGSSRIQSEKTEAARYVDGTREVTNPDFEEKQGEIQRVRDDLDAAYRANVQLQQQSSQLSAYGGNSAAFGAIASQLGNYSLQHGEQKVARLQQELASTPRTITENTYKTYHRLLTTHKVDASISIHYLLVDLHAQQAYRFDETLTDSKTVSSVMPESVDPRDPNPPAAVDTNWQGMAREFSEKWPGLSRLNREKVLQAATGKISKTDGFESWIRN